MENGTVLSTADLAQAHHGAVSIAPTPLGAGRHRLTAVYSGTANIAGGTSPQRVLTVRG